MKAALGLAALFAVAVSGGIYWNKTTPPKSGNNTVKESTTVNKLGGNIVDDLKETTNISDKKVSINRVNVDPKRVVYFNRDFNYYSVREAVKQLKELDEKSNEPILINIDSPGGSVLDGATLNAQIKSSKSPIYTVCTRLCASMAAMMHSYGHKRYALDGAILMYHPASGGAQGQVKNMLSLIKTIDRYVDKMNHNVVVRSEGKLSKEDFDKLVAYELWIDAEDALEKGLIDGIVSLNVLNSDPSLPSSDAEGNSGEEEESEELPEERQIDVQMISPYAKELWKY